MPFICYYKSNVKNYISKRKISFFVEISCEIYVKSVDKFIFLVMSFISYKEQKDYEIVVFSHHWSIQYFSRAKQRCLVSKVSDLENYFLLFQRKFLFQKWNERNISGFSSVISFDDFFLSIFNFLLSKQQNVILARL